MVYREARTVGLQNAASNHDDNAKLGARMRRGQKKGHAARYGTADEKAVLYAQYQAEVDRLRAENPHLKRNRICLMAAVKFHVTEKTVKRHTRW